MDRLDKIIEEVLNEKKKKRDRCLRIADRKFEKPSAYKSGAVVRCRKGNIWKGLKEDQLKEAIAESFVNGLNVKVHLEKQVVGLIATLVKKIKKQGKWNINLAEDKKVKKEQNIHLVDLLHQNVKILVKEKNGVKLNETLH